jgi:hypothetical protein
MENAKDIAEELYRSFKSQVLWKEVDFKRIEKFKKIISRRFILELNTEVQKLSISSEEIIEIKKVADTLVLPTDNLVQVDHQTLLQRIVEAQDEQFNINENNIIENDFPTQGIDAAKVLMSELNKAVNLLKDKRYFITIECDGIIKKPNFQLFKDADIIEKNFRTDQITRQRSIFKGYVDTHDRVNIYETIKEYFINAGISDIIEVSIDEIPVRYKDIWQNRTKL